MVTGNLRPGDTTPPSVGSSIADRYFLEGQIAIGGMGTVFRTQDRTLRRTVAVKVLHPHLAALSYSDRFLYEGQMVAALTHPNIIAIHDMGTASGLPFLVMEHIDGVSLAVLLEREVRLSTAVGIPLALQICRGLAYAHEHGVIHRDIKPQNILGLVQR